MTVRDRLAVKVAALLRENGIDVLPFTGDDLLPVTGYWKKADCYRWESVGLLYNLPGSSRPQPLSVNSWSTMTECVRAKKLKLTADGLISYEVDPADD